MPKPCIYTPAVAEILRVPVEQVHQMLTHPQYDSFRPQKAFNGKLGFFNKRQVLLMLIAGDAVRFGMKAPLAGTIAARAAEVLLFNPDADAVHFEFRAIGASFAFVGDEPPEAATAAGAARFCLSFDLRTYRAAVDAAMSDDDAE